MTRANTARHAGDTYQARVFWLNAANLLRQADPVVEVAWEKGPKGLDDIRIDYRPPKRSCNGPIERDYVQCKWHVGAGEFGYQQLVDPAFVHGETYSWMARAYDAFRADGSSSQRYTLQTNWRIDAKDPLFELKRSESNELDLKKLFTGKTERSKMGAVRECWCRHLGIDEQELLAFSATLQIADNVWSMDELRERLDDRLSVVGLQVVPTSQSAYVYDDLIIKLHSEGEVVLNNMTLQAICDREGLWQDGVAERPPYTLGIRSFMHKYDSMEHRCDSMLDLVPSFDGRFLREGKDWSTDIFPSLRAFIAEHASVHRSLRLRIDAHASIAFAVGRLLDAKSGITIEMEQRTPGTGLQYWRAGANSSGPGVDVVSSGHSNTNVVVALSITHDVLDNANAYCRSAFPSGYQLLDARLPKGPGGMGVLDGAHAWRIAEIVSASLRKHIGQRRPRIHLFAAAPNAVMFFIGQQLGLGSMSTYEFDFEGTRGGGYQAAWGLDEL